MTRIQWRIIVLVVPLFTLGCLWDYDTLKQERARFPGTLELITGKFLRHSKAFYEWRISDRLQKIKSAPDVMSHYDDLAVAYEKTGQHDKAIEIILEKEKRQPGLYETYSNLGTFHILAGDFEKGLPYIDKALAINPDAHFGREKYQKWLVEYALLKRKDGKIEFPLQNTERHFSEELSRLGSTRKDDSDFVTFVAKQQNKKSLSLEENQAAIKGILGMMRFANHENPLLLEALGDFLTIEYSHDAKQLAAMAYIKASYAVNEPDAKERYLILVRNILEKQLLNKHSAPTEEKLAVVTSELDKNLADASAWYGELSAKEQGWIVGGKNPEVEFDRLYSEEPISADAPTWIDRLEHGDLVMIRLGIVLVVIVVGAVVIFKIGKVVFKAIWR